MKTPPITAAQIAAPLSALVAVLAVVNQEPPRLQIPLLVLIGVLAVAWILADGFGIRPARAKIVVAQHNEAAAQIQSFPPDGDDSTVPTGPVAPPPLPATAILQPAATVTPPATS